MKKTMLFSLIVYLFFPGSVWADSDKNFISKQPELTLKMILKRSLDYYQVQVMEQNLAIQTALKKQAGLNPNPRLALSAEEYPNLLDQGGEFNLQWQQPWAFSGRIEKKQNWAQKNLELAQLEITLQKRALKREVTQAFFTVLSLQEYVQVTEKLFQTAHEMTQLLQHQYNQGKILLSEFNRARLIQEDLKLQKQTGQFQLNRAKTQLALYLNTSSADFQKVSGTLIQELPPLTEDQTWLDKSNIHPEMLKAQTWIEQQEANLDWQKSKGWPDLQLGIGVRYFPFQQNLGALSSINWRLPISNDNRGNIEAAQARIYQEQLKQDALKTDFFNRLQQAMLQYKQSLVTLETYQNELLPLAEENLRLNQISYNAGKLPYLALLDAQRSLYSLKQKYILEWGSFYSSQAELEYFYG